MTKLKYFLTVQWDGSLAFADKVINGEKDNEGNVTLQSIPHSAFAVLSIVLSYFETIARFQGGSTDTKRVGEYFKKRRTFSVSTTKKPTLLML